MPTCGYCCGRGRVLNHQADRYGPRPDYPADRVCEYCDGTGETEDGDRLEPQDPRRVYQADDGDRQRAGLPGWS